MSCHNSEPSFVPLWARIIDVICLTLVALGAVVAISGGFQQWIARVRLSVTSPFPLFLWALGFAIVRHWAVPRDPIYREFPVRLVRWLCLPQVRSAAIAVVGTRLPILLVGYLAVSLFGYVNGRPPLRYFNNDLLNLPVRWDGGWYLQIVTDGYRFLSNELEVQQNVVFFPAYPVLVRLVGRLFGGRMIGYVSAGMAVSLTSFFAALVYLYAFARERLDDDRAQYALWLIASYPFAVFFGAVYSESLFLLGAVAAFYHLSKAQVWQAACWGFITGLTKPSGALLSIPFAILVLSRPPGGRRLGRLAAAIAPCVGLLLYVAFIWRLTGDPLAWARGHAAWGRTFEPVTRVVARQYSFIQHAGVGEYLAVGGYDVLNMVAALFALGAAWPVGRRIGPAYAAFIAVIVVSSIASGGWLSVGRHSSVLFPVFVWLAAAIPDRHRPAWLVGFMAFQALSAALFYTWRPMF